MVIWLVVQGKWGDNPLPTSCTEPLSSTRQLPNQLQLTIPSYKVLLRISLEDLGLVKKTLTAGFLFVAAALGQNQEGSEQEVQWEGASS